MEKFLEQLKIAFASEFSFYLKAHYFHWNVEGPNFYQLHELFGDIYQEVHDNIDLFAEQIRSVKGYTPGSLSRFSMLSQIDDELSVPSADEMVKELLYDSEKMSEMFRVLFQLSEEYKEYGLNDFIGSRISAHKKHSWMLRASTKI